MRHFKNEKSLKGWYCSGCDWFSIDPENGGFLTSEGDCANCGHTVMPAALVIPLSNETHKADAGGATRICDGCNVRGNWEHKCHGKRCVVGGEQTGLPCQCSNPECVRAGAEPPEPKVIRQPKIGISVMLVKDHQLLLAKRLSGKLQGKYAAPGGHLEWMETFVEAASRELLEEAGSVANIADCEVIGVDQGFAPEEDHCWVVIFVLVKSWMGEPRCIEPDKQEPWEWYDIDNLPEATIGTIKRLCARKFSKTTGVKTEKISCEKPGCDGTTATVKHMMAGGTQYRCLTCGHRWETPCF
jgi:8-oxo-dGTP diphosphatase